MEHEAIRSEIEQKLAAKVNADRKLHNVYLLVHSERLGIHWPMAAGRTDNKRVNPDQPFHTASVGKTFTSAIVAKLVENGLAKFEDPIAHYLPESLMEGLHIYKGKEYSSDIQIKHLLSNTSGLPDFSKINLNAVNHFYRKYWMSRPVSGHLKKRFNGRKNIYYRAFHQGKASTIQTQATIYSG